MRYYCPRCGTTEHRADEVCPKDVAAKIPLAVFDRKKYQREYMRKYRARKK